MTPARRAGPRRGFQGGFVRRCIAEPPEISNASAACLPVSKRRSAPFATTRISLWSSDPDGIYRVWPHLVVLFLPHPVSLERQGTVSFPDDAKPRKKISRTVVIPGFLYKKLLKQLDNGEVWRDGRVAGRSGVRSERRTDLWAARRSSKSEVRGALHGTWRWRPIRGPRLSIRPTKRGFAGRSVQSVFDCGVSKRAS
jgi:hypothetical protein